MKLKISVQEGNIVPAFYGVAWLEWQSNQAVCFPIPFNLVASCVRSIYIYMRFGYRSVCINPRDSYMQGRKDASKGVEL